LIIVVWSQADAGRFFTIEGEWWYVGKNEELVSG